MKFEIKHRYTGKVLFSLETDSIKLAVLAAIKSYSDLNYSNLRGSDLRGSDLRGSDLRGSDLSYSNLRGSDLRGSDLRGSDLSGSDLRGSDLRYSNLRDAKNVPFVTIIGSCHSLTLQRDGILNIGYHSKPLTWWQEHYKDICKKEGYDKAAIAEYGGYIERLAAFMAFKN